MNEIYRERSTFVERFYTLWSQLSIRLPVRELTQMDLEQ